MQSDPFLTPPGQELLVTSIQPETGHAVPNREWIRVLGSAEEPFSKMDEADIRRARQLVGDASKGRMTTGEVFLIPGDPDPRPVLLHFLPVHLSTHSELLPVMVTGEVLDYPGSWTESQTEQHRMETLGRMTMGIAHDFNNLLSGIIGHAELMRSALRKQPDLDVLAEHVRTIERAATDGGELIQKIQRYIRQEQKAAFIPLDLTGLIQDCVVLTRPYWFNEPRRQGIAITVDQDLDTVPPIMGSAAELRDVLVNLILNAVQAMPSGGVIRIRAWHAENQVCLSVSDSGVGMSPAVQSQIFQPGFTTKGDRGNGVGLAVVSGVIREHSGTIEVSSTLGKGSSFLVQIPVGSAAPETSLETEERALSQGLRVLIVDDEPMVRSVLGKLLRLRGHSVTEAESGASGLDCLADGRFDVIITDQGMPEMSGREFAAKARDNGIALPIVLLTGDTHAGGADECISAVLAKPFRINEVEDTITSLVGSPV